jgi:hypothetical protein
MRRVAEVMRPHGRHWVGNGFPVRTIFSYGGDSAAVSPFLLFDYAGPHMFEPSTAPRGTPTGRKVVLPHVVVMGFDEACRVAYEHIYWERHPEVPLRRRSAAMSPPSAKESSGIQNLLRSPTHYSAQSTALCQKRT